MQDTLSPSSAKTIRNVQRDFPEWHLGRPHYLLWALDVDLEPVRQRVAAAQRHLSTRLLTSVPKSCTSRSRPCIGCAHKRSR
jgi:hypothetical protein